MYIESHYSGSYSSFIMRLFSYYQYVIKNHLSTRALICSTTFKPSFTFSAIKNRPLPANLLSLILAIKAVKEIMNKGKNIKLIYKIFSQNISTHPAMNTTPVPITQAQTTSSTNNNVPRYWETAADGKRVYEHMLQQEGIFTPQIQRPEILSTFGF